MKSTFLCLAVITQLVLAESNPTRIPLFKRHYDSDFVAAPTKELYNGMMGAVVQIGSPPQNLTMAFDTSAGFSWVAGDKCTDENCQGRKKFKPEESNSIIPSNKDFIMDYGKGIVHTTLYQDTFRYSGITVRDLPFGVAYHMYKFNRGYDGFLGLGRNINLNSAGKHYAKRDFPPPGFVPNAFQQGSGVQSQQFGMYTTTAGSGFASSGNAFADSATQTNGVNSGGYGVVKRSVDDEADGYLIIGNY